MSWQILKLKSTITVIWYFYLTLVKQQVHTNFCYLIWSFNDECYVPDIASDLKVNLNNDSAVMKKHLICVSSRRHRIPLPKVYLHNYYYHHTQFMYLALLLIQTWSWMQNTSRTVKCLRNKNLKSLLITRLWLMIYKLVHCSPSIPHGFITPVNPEKLQSNP